MIPILMFSGVFSIPLDKGKAVAKALAKQCKKGNHENSPNGTQ